MAKKSGLGIMRQWSLAFTLLLPFLNVVSFPENAYALQSSGPASVADLAEGLLDAVVNISTSQGGKTQDSGAAPLVPEGSPFSQLFDDFFKDQKGKDENKDHSVGALGSGFVIDPTGYVVTNNHVIEGADDIEVIFADGSKLKAKLIGTDTKTDLSLLKVEPKKPLKAVRFGDSKVMRIGDWVMAIGNPFGLGGTVTVGIISARGRDINSGPYDNFIQTDAAINKGNSGGPLFDMNGDVIGINTAIISPSGGSIGIGFAIPSELAEGVINQLKDFGEARRGWLGVRIQPVTDDIAESLGLDKAKGALVAGVVKGGPVDNGSIKTGDVILKFDGKDVHEMRDLPLAVAESPVGKSVDVVIFRDGKEQTVQVVLGRQTASGADDPQNPTEKAKPEDGGNQDSPDGTDTPSVTSGEMLGMSMNDLDESSRKLFSIENSVEGVVVTKVKPGSAAADKGIKAGDVIVEVDQEFMTSTGDVLNKFKDLKSQDRRSALVMISNSKGDLRLVTISLE